MALLIRNSKAALAAVAKAKTAKLGIDKLIAAD
jgi:hypothetical protein